MLKRVTTQIAVRLDDADIAALGAEVQAGRAASRSDAVRHEIARLRRARRYRDDETILRDPAERGEPVHPDLEGLLDLTPPSLD